MTRSLIVLSLIFSLPFYLFSDSSNQRKLDFLNEVKAKREFNFDTDRDNNQFPDTWFFEKGESFQQFHIVKLDSSTGYKDSQSLKISFAGGKAGLYSAPLVLDKRFSYNLHFYVKGQHLGEEFDNSLIFGLNTYNENNELIQPFTQELKVFPSDWQRSQNLRIENLPAKTHSCSLFFHLKGRPSGRSRLWIDSVNISTSPRIKIITKKELNIFNIGEEIEYEQVIEGTEVGGSYTLTTEVKDFMNQTIDSYQEKFKGSLNQHLIAKKIAGSTELNGLFYVKSALKKEDKTLIELEEMLARNTTQESKDDKREFGLILGRPKPPFNQLIQAMKTLGIKDSKIDLLPEPFSFIAYSTEEGLPELKDLLLKEAPDNGYQFTGTINQIPVEAGEHEKFSVTKAKHCCDTFPTHQNEWVQTLEDIIFKYGNVLSSWQLGEDSKPLNNQNINDSKTIQEFFNKKTSWMKTLIPYPWAKDLKGEGIEKNLYIPASMSLEELKAELNQEKDRLLNITLQLDSNTEADRVTIIENMVKKITLLKSTGQKRINKIFIDRLTHESRGLMSESYSPQSSFFAIKTMVQWLQNAQFIGSFQYPDKDIQNYTFIKDQNAFSVLWRKSSQGPANFYLGRNLQLLDLMGNPKKLEIKKDFSVSFNLNSTPLILSSPYPGLWKTILSYQLHEKDLKAAVKMQKQSASIMNHFGQLGKFDFRISYPQDWLTEKSIFSQELKNNMSEKHEMQLSPSALSPLDNAIPVWTELKISLMRPKNSHSVKIYREDMINSDVELGMNFFEAEGGLQVNIHIKLKDTATKPSSFIASALMPGGEALEALFKSIEPGEKSIQSIYLPGGKKYIGQTANLTVKENVGTRYINSSYPIQLAY
ncbi:MAG: hypothetical protein HQL32_04155 [Planctomycetes bacterium]|nr:hypothetical protein [Planctomycetota bacterium]